MSITYNKQTNSPGRYFRQNSLRSHKNSKQNSEKLPIQKPVRKYYIISSVLPKKTKNFQLAKSDYEEKTPLKCVEAYNKEKLLSQDPQSKYFSRLKSKLFNLLTPLSFSKQTNDAYNNVPSIAHKNSFFVYNRKKSFSKRKYYSNKTPEPIRNSESSSVIINQACEKINYK